MNTSLGLEVAEVTVQYGGVVAVDNVNLVAPIGRTTALIGPNGAGKTSLFDACSGFVRPTRGSINFCGHNLTGVPPEARAQKGLGRTFQRMQLFETLSVSANVASAAEASLAGSSLKRQFWATRNEKRQVIEMTEHALAVSGLEELSDHLVSSLSTGKRRLVEFARALACAPRLLLLDEPSSGLNAAETEQFGAFVKRLVREDGLGVLLVEHDMTFVAEVSDYAYVLDFGEMIFTGSMSEAAKSPEVRAAYLGSTEIQLPIEAE